MALFVDKKSGKVPGDFISHIVLLVVKFAISSQKLVNGMSRRPIHIYFSEHRELYSVIFGERLNLLVSSRLLVVKLVAGKSQYLEALASILLVDLYHSSVVSVGNNSVGGHIDDECCFFTNTKRSKTIDFVSVNVDGGNVPQGFEV